MNPSRTRQEFIDHHIHELSGYVFDAVTKQRHGGELSIWMKMIQAKLEATLGNIYDELCRQPVANGTNGKSVLLGIKKP